MNNTELQELIDNEDQVCYDLCAEIGQIFDNVKHMQWFKNALNDYLMSGGEIA